MYIHIFIVGACFMVVLRFIKLGFFIVKFFLNILKIFLQVYPAWKWFEKQDGIRSLQKNSKDPAPEFYNIYLERPKVLLLEQVFYLELSCACISSYFFKNAPDCAFPLAG